MFSKLKKLIIPALFLLCLALSGCSVGGGHNFIGVVTPEQLPMLEDIKGLETADLSGSRCYEEIMEWEENNPQVYVHYTVELPCGSIIDSSAEKAGLRLSPGEDGAENVAFFRFLPKLRELSVSCGSEEQYLDTIGALIRLRPDLRLDFSFEIEGYEISSRAEELRLTGISSPAARALCQVLPALSQLERVDLGSDISSPELSFYTISALEDAAPQAAFDYSFTLYGREYTLRDTVMDLRRVPISDEGTLVRAAVGCMRELQLLDMDSCGVSNEAMAKIRDDFPGVKVVWRIWFGDNYTVRTDVETILASRPSVGGMLNYENSKALKYCTDVRFLDVGHNESLDDISFIEYMPDLEVAILAMGCWSDTSSIAHCPKLEYLEIQTTELTDLSPLSELKNLRHLNICYLDELDDISPLYKLTELERLWIGCLDPVPPEQIAHMQQCAPQCEINTTTLDPTEGGWRFVEGTANGLAPRYALLRQQFGYDMGNMAFAFPWNDPLFWQY